MDGAEELLEFEPLIEGGSSASSSDSLTSLESEGSGTSKKLGPFFTLCCCPSECVPCASVGGSCPCPNVPTTLYLHPFFTCTSGAIVYLVPAAFTYTGGGVWTSTDNYWSPSLGGHTYNFTYTLECNNPVGGDISLWVHSVPGSFGAPYNFAAVNFNPLAGGNSCAPFTLTGDYNSCDHATVDGSPTMVPIDGTPPACCTCTGEVCAHVIGGCFGTTPLPGVPITVTSGSFSGGCTTGSDGTCCVPVPPGTYTVAAHGYYVLTATVVMPPDCTPPPATVTFHMPPSAVSICASLRDFCGNPPPDGVISFSAGGSCAVGVTDCCKTIPAGSAFPITVTGTGLGCMTSCSIAGPCGGGCALVLPCTKVCFSLVGCGTMAGATIALSTGDHCTTDGTGSCCIVIMGDTSGEVTFTITKTGFVTCTGSLGAGACGPVTSVSGCTYDGQFHMGLLTGWFCCDGCNDPTPPLHYSDAAGSGFGCATIDADCCAATLSGPFCNPSGVTGACFPLTAPKTVPRTVSVVGCHGNEDGTMDVTLRLIWPVCCCGPFLPGTECKHFIAPCGVTVGDFGALEDVTVTLPTCGSGSTSGTWVPVLSCTDGGFPTEHFLSCTPPVTGFFLST